MTLAEFLADVAKRLNDASIEYMIAGSVAGSTHGEPRSTRDVDIVIEATGDSLRALFGSLDRLAVHVDETQPRQPAQPRTSSAIVRRVATEPPTSIVVTRLSRHAARSSATLAFGPTRHTSSII